MKQVTTLKTYNTTIIRLVFVFVLITLLTSCNEVPVTYVFIEVPTEVSGEEVSGEEIPDEEIPDEEALPPLDVEANIHPICEGNERLVKVTVQLKVLGGTNPYTVNGEEIVSSQPSSFTLQSGQYNEFVIRSGDGQEISKKIWAPSSCDDATDENVFSPPIIPPANTPVSPPANTPVSPPANTPVPPPTNTPVPPPANTPCPTNSSGHTPPGKCK